MAETTTLAEAVGQPVVDGALVALEGLTHLISFAPGHWVRLWNREPRHHAPRGARSVPRDGGLC